MIISSVHIKKESYWLRKNDFYQFWINLFYRERIRAKDSGDLFLYFQ